MAGGREEVQADVHPGIWLVEVPLCGGHVVHVALKTGFEEANNGVNPEDNWRECQRESYWSERETGEFQER